MFATMVLIFCTVCADFECIGRAAAIEHQRATGHVMTFHRHQRGRA